MVSMDLADALCSPAYTQLYSRIAVFPAQSCFVLGRYSTRNEEVKLYLYDMGDSQNQGPLYRSNI